MLALRVHISLRWLRFALVLYCVNVDYYSVPVKINGLKRVSIGILILLFLYHLVLALRVHISLRQYSNITMPAAALKEAVAKNHFCKYHIDVN